MSAPSIREMADQHPGSVWQSLVDWANWTRRLDVSPTARRLTALRGPQFRRAVAKMLADARNDDGQRKSPDAQYESKPQSTNGESR